jgi:hypothetical protein
MEKILKKCAFKPHKKYLMKISRLRKIAKVETFRSKKGCKFKNL